MSDVAREGEGQSWSLEVPFPRRGEVRFCSSVETMDLVITSLKRNSVCVFYRLLARKSISLFANTLLVKECF